MPFTIDISPWLISAMLSDLNQTADFTAKGYKEGNPIAKPLVQSRNSTGEVGLGALGTVLALTDLKKYNKYKPLWAALHTAAVVHNRRKTGADIPAIMFPVISVEW